MGVTIVFACNIDVTQKNGVWRGPNGGPKPISEIPDFFSKSET